MTKKDKTEHNMFMQYIEYDCKVDIEQKQEYPPVCLSYGEKVIQSDNGDTLIPVALGTYGNLSVITAPPKTKKTFFVSLLASAYLSGTNIYGGDIKGHRENGDLVHFDTEQGLWHASKVFRRPLDMDSKIPAEKYHTFALRTIGHKDRIDFIDYYLTENIKEPSLIIIDGIADLVSNVNDLDECSLITQKLMKWSTRFNCHIINIIHQNFGSTKLGTGHLGSALEKKAETIIALEANTVNRDWTTVKCGRSRGYSFDTFSFEVNEKGLPTIVTDLYDPLR